MSLTSFDIFSTHPEHDHSHAGFTLIELLIVVAFIGVLAAIALPHFNLYRARAANSTAQTDLRNSINGQEASYLDREVYWDCMNSGCNDPALPGMTVSPGVSIACTPREDAQKVRCSARHHNGTLTYYYDSENSAFWEQ